MAMLYVREGSGYREAHAEEVLARAEALLSQRFRAGSPVLSSPERTAQFLSVHLGGRNYEVFGLMHLDARHRLIEVEDLFRGTLDGASVHPREVAKSVLARGSAAVILYHNHASSGVAEPSAADEIVTKRLKEMLALFDVKVLDHLIVGETIFSMAAHGLI